jgi:hypothetical protein
VNLDVLEGPGGSDHLDNLVRALKRGEYLR